MKYLFLGEFLLLAQQNTKCHDLGMLAAGKLLCFVYAHFYSIG